MLKTLQSAFKIKEIRKRMLFTFLMLLVVRFGSLLPIPGVDTSYFNTILSGDGWFPDVYPGLFDGCYIDSRFSFPHVDW